ncbi:MAG: DMT family transporter [Sedimentisphaerales bacterium]|nr:DMT family transporter [Sedimentisphaerales bacterium]
MTTKTKGVLAIVGASGMWAVEPILAKLAYANSDALTTSAVRAVTVVPLALVYLFVTRSRLCVSRRQWPAIVYIALAATMFADLVYLYAISLQGYPVVNAVLIGHMQPVFIVLIAWFVFREERLSGYDVLGILIMIVSGLLVSTRSWDNLLKVHLGTLGDALVLIASIAWATTTIAARKYLRNLHAGVLSLYRYGIAAILLPLAVFLRQGLPPINRYQIFVGLVVGLGTILYYEGLTRLKAAQVSALELTTLFFAGILAFVTFQETVTILQGAGMILLAGGVYCLAHKEQLS